MKKFLTVLNFELSNYFKKKSFVISTAILSLIMIVVLSLPSFVDLSKLIPGFGGEEKPPVSSSDKTQYAYYDPNNIIKDTNLLTLSFKDSEWTKVNSVSDLEDKVNNKDVKAGFSINDYKNYTYYVINKKITDTTQMEFDAVLTEINRHHRITEEGLDYNKIQGIYTEVVTSDIQVLGKDSSNNFFYTYLLVFVLYMIVLMYGQLIAISVTSEKSNRAIEVLVTSTSTNSLIFGKVIAGAIASVAQVGVIMASGIITYKLNSEAWNGMLDMVFNIPSNLLVTFALFGIVGYLFYAFLFGALGALVSKTEEIGTSVGPLMMVFVAVFLISIFGLNNGDSLLIKIASFIPFSSPMTMLVRVAMGTVSIVEIGISFVILVVSTFGAGLIGAKIYRMGTLMYGNPIKLRNLFKMLKKNG